MLGVEVEGQEKAQLLLLMARLIKVQHVLDLEIYIPPSFSSILPSISSPDALLSKYSTIL